GAGTGDNAAREILSFSGQSGTRQAKYLNWWSRYRGLRGARDDYHPHVDTAEGIHVASPEHHERGCPTRPQPEPYQGGNRGPRRITGDAVPRGTRTAG